MWFPQWTQQLYSTIFRVIFKWYCIYKLDLCLEDFKAGTIWDNMPHSLQAWNILMKFKYVENTTTILTWSITTKKGMKADNKYSVSGHERSTMKMYQYTGWTENNFQKITRPSAKLLLKVTCLCRLPTLLFTNIYFILVNIARPSCRQLVKYYIILANTSFHELWVRDLLPCLDPVANVQINICLMWI